MKYLKKPILGVGMGGYWLRTKIPCHLFMLQNLNRKKSLGGMEPYLGIMILYIDEMLRYWVYYFTLF